MELVKPRQWDMHAIPAVIAGIFWLAAGSGHWLIWGVVPGALLIAAGLSLLLWPGDMRIVAYIAAGGVLGMVMAIPAMFAGGFVNGLTAGLLSLGAFLIAGRASLSNAGRSAGVPELALTPLVCAKAALDEALLAYFVGAARLPNGDEADLHCNDAARFADELEAVGAYQDLRILHRTPSAPEDARLEPGRLLKRRFEMLRFSSGFVPNPRFPGAEQWASYRSNQECHAIVMKHDDGPRPWLLCIHGYRMGLPWMDLGLFRPEWLHDRLGLNLVVPTLPLHGPRRIGWRSGDHYLDGGMIAFVHAQTQALWDLRRTVAWIRSQDPDARIGVLGFSLGGYNTALLAAYEAGLDFVVAGIPLIDVPAVLWRHTPLAHREYFESRGLNLALIRRLLSAVSPLASPPLVDIGRRAIFAGIADRIVPPENPVQLSAHWGIPVEWYPGGHLTFSGEGAVHRALNNSMTRAGWPQER